MESFQGFFTQAFWQSPNVEILLSGKQKSVDGSVIDNRPSLAIIQSHCDHFPFHYQLQPVIQPVVHWKMHTNCNF